MVAGNQEHASTNMSFMKLLFTSSKDNLLFFYLFSNLFILAKKIVYRTIRQLNI